MDRVVEFFSSTLGLYVPKEIVVLIISMIPILELRGGLLASAVLKIPITTALPLCIVGNIIPIPFILLFIKKIFQWLKLVSFIRPMIEKLEVRAMKKSAGIGKAEFWGLTLFVGIPLPGTGAWTGSLIASLLEIDIKKAVLANLLGIAIAAVIMSIVSYGLLGFFI